MKASLLVSIVALCVLLISESEAAPELRQKRATSVGVCPEGSSDEECRLYAKQKSAGKCMRYNLSNGKIHFASCVKVLCDEPLILGKKDLSKPYPDCCASCEFPK